MLLDPCFQWFHTVGFRHQKQHPHFSNPNSFQKKPREGPDRRTSCHVVERTALTANKPIFYDNVRKPVPECETILDFADARDDGRGSGDNQHSKNRCKSFTPGYSHHQRHTNTQFFAGWTPPNQQQQQSYESTRQQNRNRTELERAKYH